MEVRIEKTSEFYHTMKDWWGMHIVEHDGIKIPFPAIPLLALPKNTFVVSDDGVDLYSCCFYETDSALGYVAYPISNLYVEKEKRIGGLEYLLNKIEAHAKKTGYLMLYTTSPIKPVQEALLKVGYGYGDKIVTQYFKAI